jgi:serine/threonine protein kinase
MDELIIIANSIKDAKCPEDVFGGNGSAIMTVYRQLVLTIHPDHFQNDSAFLAIANEAFNRLSTLRGEAERKVKAGTYGKKKVPAPPPKKPFSPIAMEVNGKKFILTELLEHGDLCDIYLATHSNGSADHKVVFKVTRQGSDNDLVENEAKILRKLYPETAKDEKFYRFLPKLAESFVLRSPGSQRRVNILPWLNEYHSLVDVLRVYPDGVDFRDMVWMFKRILHGVGFAHENSVIHGALIPSHVMIHPVNHGAKIIDWAYAVSQARPDAAKPKSRSLYDHLRDDSFLTTQHIKAISAEYRHFYPPEVFDKKPATAATDIYMAAKCAVALVGGDVKIDRMPDAVPKPVQAFFSACLQKSQAKRPQGAWETHEQLDDILSRVVGKRKYRPFPMPVARV